ncbi:MAG: hypothetical protein AAF184_00070 [Pseudomonadota bacterium]
MWGRCLAPAASFVLMLLIAPIGALSAQECDAPFEQVSEDGFGDSNNRYAWSMAVFGDHLYVGTLNRLAGAQIWRYDGSVWEQVVSGGLGSIENEGVRSLAVCRGAIYAGTDNLTEGAQLWRSADGVTWNVTADGGIGDPTVRSVRSLTCATFDDVEYLYFGTQDTDGGAKLFRTREQGIQPLVLNGFGDARNDSIHEMELFQGALYAGTRNAADGLQIWRTFDGVTFSGVVGPTAQTPGGFDYESTGAAVDLHTFQDQLYVGTINAFNGFGVWRSADGEQWEKIGADGFGVPGNDYSWRYITFEDQLWLGTLNAFSFFGFPTGAGVWRSADGAQWEELVGSPRATYLGWGFDDSANIGTRSLAEFQGQLYLGTAQDSRPFAPRTGLEVWRWRSGQECAPVAD